MASTFSPDLRLELIGTGDQAGAWGATLNANLGTLVESAIAGATTVTVTSAAQALTALNGADDESRHAILVLTNTNGANFSVFAPPAPKVYVVHNASAYTATIYNSTVLGNTTAAGTGVALATGQKLLVFSDGTNFRTIDAAAFTGILSLASGGTGAATAAGARANLGLVIGTNVPSPTGAGASGTWGINISGNAATATTDAQHFGVSQTWQDVTSSRAKNTWYQNTTGRPIEVSVTPLNPDLYFPAVQIGASTSAYVTLSTGPGLAYTVPAGHYYGCFLGDSTSIVRWNELR